jgi:hypothetical protein
LAERPKLPLEVQASIERSIEIAIAIPRVSYDILFALDTQAVLMLAGSSPQRRQRKPATLKLQLRQYARSLFDAEAGYYPEHADSDEQLREWLSDLSELVSAEIAKELESSMALLNFHCTLGERKAAIDEELIERTNHWVSLNRQRFKISLMRGTEPAVPRTRPHRPIEAITTLEQVPSPTTPPLAKAAKKTLGERLDEAKIAADISHEEQAHRIGLSRTVYFEVKAGRGGRGARRKTEKYLVDLPQTNRD